MVRDRGSPNRELQYTSQGLLVTHREVQLTISVRLSFTGPVMRQGYTAKRVLTKTFVM